MNDVQKEHLKYILTESRDRIMDKYIKGSIEHDSNLNEDYTVNELLEEAINEAVDQLTYLLTLRQKLNGE